MLEQLDRELNAAGIHLAFVELRDRLKELTLRYGLMDTLDKDHFYPSIEAAVAAIRAEGGTAEKLAACGPSPAAIRASATTVSQARSGIAADGEAPGCAAAIRTCSAAGRVLKRKGASSVTASPSMPAAIGPSASISKAGADHSPPGAREKTLPDRRRGDGDPK